MHDREKSKERLIDELVCLRQQVVELKELSDQNDPSDRMLTSIVKAVPDIIYRLDAKGRIVFMNEAVRNYGYEPDELIGTNIFELVHPEDREKAVYRINERRTGDRSTRLLELRLLTKNREPVSFEFAASIDDPTLLINAEGIYTLGEPGEDAFLYTQGVARDITDRKWASRVMEMAKEELAKKVKERTAELRQANEELQKEIANCRRIEEELRLTQFAVDRAGDAIFWFGPDGRFFYVNDEASRMLGYTREQLTSMNIIDLDPDFPSREKWGEIWEGIKRDPGIRRLETWHRTSEGDLIPVEVTGNYLKFGGKEYVCTSARDISDRKRQEGEREKLEEQLLHVQKLEAIGQLTAGVAHNFNNMLQGITGNIFLAQLDAPEEMVPLLEAAQVSSDRAAEMVRQLMIFARQGIVQKGEWTELGAVIQNSIEICRETFDRQIEIREQMPDGKALLQGDPGQLEQVFVNLLINARDALEEVVDRTPTIQIQGEFVELEEEAVRTVAPGTYLRVRVEDNGVGMDEETRRRIFEPFFTTKPVDKGTGLGLSTAYGIISQHGGCIECESDPGSGSCFTVYLPVAEQERGGEDSGSGGEAIAGEEVVLIIDDEETVRRTAGRILERYGFRVLVAADGREGLDIFRQEKGGVDLVLLDLSMPGISGSEVLATLRTLSSQVKIVIFTGYTAKPEDFVEVQAIIQKPFALNDLTRTVRRVLDGE